MKWQNATVRNDGNGRDDPSFEEAVERFKGKYVALLDKEWQCVGLLRTPRSILEGPFMATTTIGKKLYFGRIYLLLKDDDQRQVVTTLAGVEIVDRKGNRPPIP